jgi:hypothetical protein
VPSWSPYTALVFAGEVAGRDPRPVSEDAGASVGPRFLLEQIAVVLPRLLGNPLRLS